MRGCVLADGAYDSRVIYDDMYCNNIKLAVPVRKNSRSDTPSYPRWMEVRIQKRDYTEWKKSSGYEKRWPVESLFSAIKRMFGESWHTKKHDARDGAKDGHIQQDGAGRMTSCRYGSDYGTGWRITL